jgi:hypothetical protein
MTFDTILFVLIGGGLALSAIDLFYQLHHQARAKKSARRLGWHEGSSTQAAISSIPQRRRTTSSQAPQSVAGKYVDIEATNNAAMDSPVGDARRSGSL